VSHDKLTKFLSNNEEKTEPDIKNIPKGGSLIFDDTSINKSFPKKVEGVRLKLKQFAWQSGVSFSKTASKIIYVHGNKIYNLADIIWEKERGL